MHVPLVSIVMPVYNSAPWLKEAIDSMLNQNFTDFELIILNDGSTDQSERIILTFTDNRIRYYRNEHNQGLVYTLNRGLGLSGGKYIARMDGDDVSEPARLAKQVSYLNAVPEADLVATVATLIDENGKPLGFWKEDKQHVTPEAIRSFMPVNNCIAHPGILGKAEILKKFRYRENQRQAEDYDLWLRLLAAGCQIHKLDEPLLKHRILTHSFTRSRQKNVFFKLAETKWRFAWNECKTGKVNGFILRTAGSGTYDVIRGTAKTIKKLFIK